MNCSRWRRRIALLVGDDLDSADTRRVENHLQGCPECRQLEHDLRCDLAGLREIDDRAVEAAGLESVRGAVMARIKKRQPKRGMFGVPGLAAAAAAAALVVFVAVSLRPGAGGPEPRIVDGGEASSRVAEEIPGEPSETRQPVLDSVPEPTEDVEISTAAEPVVRTAPARSPEPRETVQSPRSASAEPMTMKILTDDPDVVIYWIVEAKGEKTNA